MQVAGIEIPAGKINVKHKTKCVRSIGKAAQVVTCMELNGFWRPFFLIVGFSEIKHQMDLYYYIQLFSRNDDYVIVMVGVS